MKANYTTRERKKAQLSELTEATYVAFQKAALQTLVEDYHWGTNVKHAKDQLRIERFDHLTNDIFSDFLREPLRADTKAVLLDVLFVDECQDPQKDSGFVANLQSLLVFCQMLALKRVAGFGNDRLSHFSDLVIARYPDAVKAAGWTPKGSAPDESAAEKKPIGYECERMPKAFYAQVGKLILNLPYVLKGLRYDQSWRAEINEENAALDE